MANLDMKQVDFNFTCGTTKGFNLDGLADYTFSPQQETVVLSDAISTQGTKVVKRFASKAVEITISAIVGSNLDDALLRATGIIGAPFIGTLKDERRANSTIDISFNGGIVKPERQFSADTTDYIIRGNLTTDAVY